MKLNSKLFFFFFFNLFILNFAFAESKKFSNMMLATVTCYKDGQDSWSENVLVLYEPWPIKCDQEFSSRTAIMTLSSRKKEEDVNHPIELPMLQHTGTFKRNRTGGFELSIKIEGKIYKVELKDENSKTVVNQQGVDAEGYAKCRVAPFRNFCTR